MMYVCMYVCIYVYNTDITHACKKGLRMQCPRTTTYAASSYSSIRVLILQHMILLYMQEERVAW